MDLAILVGCSLTMAILGTLVLARNKVSRTNRRFALVSLALIAWMTFNYLSDMAPSNNLLFTRLTFTAGILTALAFMVFTAYFPNDQALRGSRLLRLHFIVTLLVAPLTLTPFFVESVGSAEAATIQMGQLYPIFVGYLVLTMFLMVRIMYKQQQAASTRSQKQQVAFLTTGIILYSVLTIISNVLLPLIVGNWASSRFGPLFTLFFAAIIGYAIIKRQLFDVRFTIVRSMGYILSLAFVGAVSFAVLRWATLLLDGLDRFIQIDLFVLITMGLAVSYQYFRRIFDRITSRLFYRDAYDTQTLINEFNQVIVSTLVLEDLLDRAGSVIQKYIKTDGVSFAIVDPEGNISVISSTRTVNKALVRHIEVFEQHADTGLIVADNLDNNRNFQNLLQHAGVGLVARLNIDQDARWRGYVLLGHKKSGNMFSPIDLSMMPILANGLSIAVHNALQFTEIQKFNVTLKQKIQEATRHLQQTNDKLRHLDQTKDDFISMASHQLRTPLTSIKGYVSMVLEGDAGNVSPLQKKLLAQAFVSSQRMVYLISDLLNVSRLRTGKFVVETSPTNLATIAREEVNQLQETAKSRGIELTVKHTDHFPALMLDETKMRQVIMNFIDNAIYYTPEGGHISVNVTERPRSIELTVVDSGMGVPKADQPHLFSKFFRADNAKRARPDGTGLGLFMAKKVVMAQGGAIIFKSTEGKGSTFGFTFSKDKVTVVKNYKPVQSTPASLLHKPKSAIMS